MKCSKPSLNSESVVISCIWKFRLGTTWDYIFENSHKSKITRWSGLAIRGGGPKWDFADITQRSRGSGKSLGLKIGGAEGGPLGPSPRSAPGKPGERGSSQEGLENQSLPEQQRCLAPSQPSAFNLSHFTQCPSSYISLSGFPPYQTKILISFHLLWNVWFSCLCCVIYAALWLLCNIHGRFMTVPCNTLVAVFKPVFLAHLIFHIICAIAVKS